MGVHNFYHHKNTEAYYIRKGGNVTCCFFEKLIHKLQSVFYCPKAENSLLWKITFDKLFFAQKFHYTFEDPARLARAFDSLCSRDCTPIVVFFHDKSKHTQVQLTNDTSGNYTWAGNVSKRSLSKQKADVTGFLITHPKPLNGFIATEAQWGAATSELRSNC